MATNGYLKIKTKIDNSGVDKDIQQLENKIKKLQQDNTTLSSEQSVLQQEIEQYDLLTKEADKYNQKLKELNIQKSNMTKSNPELVVGKATPEYSRLQSEIEQVKQRYTNATLEIDKQAPKLEKVYSKLDKVKSKQSENNSKMTEFKSKIESIQVKKVESSMNNIGKSIQSQISKIGKMAMGVFGVASAFYAVKRALDLVKQNNPQIATDFEYMGFAISQMLLPVAQKLVQVLYTILSYVNAITTAWFSFNMFQNASVNNFKKMNSSAKKLEETLSSTSFDEQNTLQSNNSNDGSDASGVNPIQDLSKDIKIPQWLQWIIDNKDLVLGIITGIAIAFAGIKILEFISNLKKVKEGLDLASSSKFWTLLGKIALIVGALWAVHEAFKAIGEYKGFDNIVEVFGKILVAITLVFIAVGVLFGSLIPGLIAGLVTTILVLITFLITHWEAFAVGLQHIFKTVIDWLLNKWKSLGDFIVNILTTLGDWIINKFNIVGNFFSDIWKGMKDGFINAMNGIKDTFVVIWNFIINSFSSGGQIFGGFVDGITNVFKTVINFLIRGINKVIASPFNTINGLLNKIKSVDVMGIKPFNGFWSYSPLPVPQLPQLAKGGIVSKPTRAIIGEAGTEAVMPLENNTQWIDILADKLASKIGSSSGGSYILNIDGRTIQRGIAKRQNQLAFATNGRG